MKRHLILLSLVITLITVASCGNVEWFPSNTVNNEPTPSPFSFDPVLCADPSSDVESKEIEISNVTSTATVTVTGGEYLTSGGVWTSESKLYTPGADRKLKIKVRHTTASLTGTTPVTITTLKVGNTTGYFYSDISKDSTWCN